MASRLIFNLMLLLGSLFVILFEFPVFADLRVPEFYQKNRVSRNISLDRDIVKVNFSQKSRLSDTFFNDKNDRKNLKLRFTEFEFITGVHYGILDDLTFGFNFPAALRNGKDLSATKQFKDIYSYGLGDISFDLFYNLFNYKVSDLNFNTGLFFIAKYPSADTSIGTAKYGRVLEPELPLGNGQVEYTFGLKIKQKFFSLLASQLDFSYKVRGETPAEYLQVQSQVIPGTPIGNKMIDFGDEINAGSTWIIQITDSLCLEEIFDFRYRKKTLIDGTEVKNYPKLNLNLSKGWLFTGTQAINYKLTGGTELELSNTFPLSGYNYPLVSLAFVDSLVGLLNLNLTFNWYFD